jgi:hypothetical protein
MLGFAPLNCVAGSSDRGLGSLHLINEVLEQTGRGVKVDATRSAAFDMTLVLTESSALVDLGGWVNPELSVVHQIL